MRQPVFDGQSKVQISGLLFTEGFPHARAVQLLMG
tara:strand:+ start:564 stop:668 length:105 start_codon:yes stop_codon:yes gene_type:complete